MNLVYDPLNDTYLAATTAQAMTLTAEYKALRQALYDLLSQYSREDAIKALKRTLEDWQA